MGLEEDFLQAVDEVSNKINKTMSNDELKEVYALYKQATVGDINTTRPGMLDLKVLWMEYPNTLQDIFYRGKPSGMLGIPRKGWPRTRPSKSMSSLPNS